MITARHVQLNIGSAHCTSTLTPLPGNGQGNGARSALLSLTTQDGDNIDGTHAIWQDSASATTYAADTFNP